MGERRNQKLIAAATRLMREDEQVELTTMAKLGFVAKHLASFPRDLVASGEPASSVLGLKVGLEVQGLDRPLKLTFPPVPRALRGQCRDLARALAEPGS